MDPGPVPDVADPPFVEAFRAKYPFVFPLAFEWNTLKNQFELQRALELTPDLHALAVSTWTNFTNGRELVLPDVTYFSLFHAYPLILGATPPGILASVLTMVPLVYPGYLRETDLVVVAVTLVQVLKSPLLSREEYRLQKEKYAEVR